MKEVLQEILDGEMTELLGAERHATQNVRVSVRLLYFAQRCTT
jgi:transposase-like protein